MKGIILAGGTGSRLEPCTKVTNKHLLPVYNKPMIYYPLQTLIDAGMKEIIIVSGKGHAGHFVNLLGSGKDFGVKLSYEVQDEAGGIAQALSLTETFCEKQSMMVILGDNIFEDTFVVNDFSNGAKVYLKEVPDPQRFGVADINSDGKVLSIEEKPTKPKSHYAVTGLYLYDPAVFDVIRKLEPSKRGELEITDVNNAYLKRSGLRSVMVKGFWSDAGTFESLYHATNLVMRKLQNK